MKLARVPVWAIFAVALALRLTFLAVFLVRGMDVAIGRDLYYDLALSWLGWKPPFAFDVTHPPLYTVFIAAVLGVFRSSSPLPVLILQCGVGALCAPLTWALGRRLVDEDAARLAALWIAFDPGLIYFAPQLGTETLFIAMELGFFIWLLDELKRPISARTALAGLWGGLAVTCRSVIGGYPAFLFLVLWRARGLYKALLFCAVLGLGWLAPSFAWSVRNYFKYGKVIPVATVMGSNLYEGFTLDRDEIRRRPADMDAEAASLGFRDDVIAKGDHFKRKTMAFMRARPLEAAKIILGKTILFWRPFPYDPHTWWQRGALGIYFTILFALAAYGARLVWANAAWSPVWALFAYLTVLHSVFFTSLRYRLPLEPFLCVLAAAGLLKIARKYGRLSA